MSIAISTLVDRQDRFSELLVQHQGIVGKVVGTYSWHPDDRDDLSQEIVTQLWRSFPRYDDQQPFATWMYRVALNVAISWVRGNSLRRRHMTALGDDVHDVADTRLQTPDDDRAALLQGFIKNLDPLNRALILLYLEQRTYREISEILGISETNVATKISRLKQGVRKYSAEFHGEGATHGTR